MTDITEQNEQDVPIVCDLTDAPDTPAERLAEYERLFVQALVGKERVGEGIRFRFRAEPGLEDWVRDLAAKEKACCAFFTFDIAVHGDEVWLDASVVDDELARQILDEYYRLPESLAEGAEVLFDRFTQQGLQVMTRDDGVLRPATTAEHGWPPQ